MEWPAGKGKQDAVFEVPANSADEPPWVQFPAMSALLDSEMCRGILESLPTGLCVVDLQKKIVLWSSGAEWITGHLRYEVIRQGVSTEAISKLTGWDRKTIRKYLQQTNAQPEYGPRNRSSSKLRGAL